MDLKDRTEMPLWCGMPPAGESDPEQIPAITPYAPLVWKKNHRALVIFPGGAYCNLDKDEGPGLAEFFSAQGYYCFVVKYRVSHIHDLGGCHHPAPLSDAARAVRLSDPASGGIFQICDAFFNILFYPFTKDKCFTHVRLCSSISCIRRALKPFHTLFRFSDFFIQL